MPDRFLQSHETIIAISSKAAVGAGSVTATGGAMSWLAGNAEAISAICMIIGAVIAVTSFLVNLHYQRKRDARDLRG